MGRGGDQSYCIMVNASGDKEKNQRLEVLNKSNDGFFIASEDLRLRGPGDIFRSARAGTWNLSWQVTYGRCDLTEGSPRMWNSSLRLIRSFPPQSMRS